MEEMEGENPIMYVDRIKHHIKGARQTTEG